LGGIGGGLIYWALYEALAILPGYQLSLLLGGGISLSAAAVAAIFAVGVFFVNAVVASYNIGGTIEGFHDPKFKRLPKGVLACLVASLVTGLIAVLLLKGGVF
jgi:tetrahydromethanopterin S-methyltransferase subunit D